MSLTRLASDRLYHGEAASFLDACRLAAQAAREEIAAQRRLAQRYGADTSDQSHYRDIEAYGDQARAAAAIYQKHVSAVTALAAAEMRAAGMQEFADALETGDYSKLAI